MSHKFAGSGNSVSQRRDFSIVDDCIVGIRPINQARLDRRSLARWQFVQHLALRPEIKDRRRITCDRRQVGEGWIVTSLIKIPRRTNQPNLATASEYGHVKDLQTLSNCKFCYEIPQRRNASSVKPAVQMIPAEAQEHLCIALARLHPIVMKEILHDFFATLRGAKTRTGISIPLDL